MLTIEQVFKALNEAKVDYLLVGGIAAILYGAPRTTVDIDVVIRPTEANIRKAIKALGSLGLVPDTDRADEILGQGGVSFSNERDIDMLTDLKGVDFGAAWTRKKIVEYEGVRVKVLSKDDLKRNLKAVGRPKDLEDLKDIE